MITWMVAWTARNAEFRAREAMLAEGFHVFLPTELHWDRHGLGKTAKPVKKVERPLFPRYIFVGLINPDDWPRARHADGVEAIKGRLNNVGVLRLHQLEQAQVDGLYDFTQEPPPINYRPGTPVKVIDGAFTGWAGKIARMDREGRVQVMLANMLGRQTKMTLGVNEIEVAA